MGETIWLANMLSGGVIVSLLIFFFKRVLKSIFDSIAANKKEHDERIEKAEFNASEIRKNYIKRFEDVHCVQHETKDLLLERLQEMKDEKIEYRMQQIEIMADIKHGIENLKKDIERNNKN